MSSACSVDLFDQFLRHRTYRKDFCFELIDAARQPSVSWDTRCLAALMAEHQVLKLRPDDLENFEALFAQLNLRLTADVLKQGYSTNELRSFVIEFRNRLARLNRVHRKIQGSRTNDAARQDFIETSRHECKLTLARYLFTPDEVVERILVQLKLSQGIRDIDLAQPRYINAEISHALGRLPEFEARILRRLCEGARIYWVGDATSQRINSLVEYPLTTVVLAIKPPGSHFEFELKRAGRKGNNPLNVVFTRNGNRVPPSHRLDGGSMQWLLRYEARNSSKLSSIYRLVHGAEAPLPGYVSRNTIFTVPARGQQAPAFRYFTEPRVFGEAGFREMRASMGAAVKALQDEEGENLPELPGDLALTAEFLSHVAPAQAILCGTSSFRLDKLATYLSAAGAETYFKQYLGVDYTADEARRFADELLEEVLGVYKPPDVYRDFDSYVETALSLRENRRRADQLFLSLVRQIAAFWGTMLGARGHSRGESFVARNVGLRSVWEDGQWQVKLIFMDHDGLSLPELEHGHFFAEAALRGMLLDERHVWGRANPALFAGTLVGCLRRIYRTSDDLETPARCLAEEELKAAYQKTQQAVLNNRKLRAFFSEVFISRLFDWDQFAAGYVNGREESWKSEMKELFAGKGYEADAFEYYVKSVEKHQGFIERNAFLFER